MAEELPIATSMRPDIGYFCRSAYPIWRLILAETQTLVW